MWCAVKNVLQQKFFLMIFILITAFFFGLFILLPIFIIPGNNLELQLSLYVLKDYILLFLLAVLLALNFVLQIFCIKYRRRCNVSQTVITGSVSWLPGFFAALIGTASCASCLFPLFALFGLGAGSVLFVLKYQIYFVGGAVIITLVALYFVAKKILNICKSCTI